MDHPSDAELVAYSDGELPNASRASVAGHLMECAACREVLQQLVAVDRKVRVLPRAVAPRGLAVRALERARYGGEVHYRRRLVAVAGAACLLLGVGGGWGARAVLHSEPRAMVRDAEGLRFMLTFIENLDTKASALPVDRARASREFGAWLRSFGVADGFLGGAQLVANGEQSYGSDTQTAANGTHQATGFIVVRAQSHSEVAAFAIRCPIIALGGRVVVRQLR